jgi:hypothetical protein
MQYSPSLNETATKNDEALAQEFVEYISLVSDSIVRSQFKYDFSAIEKLIATVRDEVTPMQEAAHLSASIDHQLRDVQSRLLELREQWQTALKQAIDDLNTSQQSVFETTTGSCMQKMSAMIDGLTGQLQKDTSRCLDSFSRTPSAIAELGDTIGRRVDDLSKRHQTAFETTADSYLQKMSAMIDGLIGQLQNDTNRYLGSLSRTPAAIAELGGTICLCIEDRSRQVSDEARKASAATEGALRFFIENKASATAKEIIAACSKNVDEASTRIQTEFRLKTDVVSTEIGNDQKSRKADLDVAFGGLKDGIAQLQEKALAAIKDADATNKQRADGINGQIRKMLEQTSQTDQRILTMQKWVWGLGGFCLLALLGLMFKAVR